MKIFLSSTVTDLKTQCADQEMNGLVIQYSLQCDGLSVQQANAPLPNCSAPRLPSQYSSNAVAMVNRVLECFE
jgi:hypothetical protein